MLEVKYSTVRLFERHDNGAGMDDVTVAVQDTRGVVSQVVVFHLFTYWLAFACPFALVVSMVFAYSNSVSYSYLSCLLLHSREPHVTDVEATGATAHYWGTADAALENEFCIRRAKQSLDWVGLFLSRLFANGVGVGIRVAHQRTISLQTLVEKETLVGGAQQAHTKLCNTPEMHTH